MAKRAGDSKSSTLSRKPAAGGSTSASRARRGRQEVHIGDSDSDGVEEDTLNSTSTMNVNKRQARRAAGGTRKKRKVSTDNNNNNDDDDDDEEEEEEEEGDMEKEEIPAHKGRKGAKLKGQRAKVYDSDALDEDSDSDDADDEPKSKSKTKTKAKAKRKPATPRKKKKKKTDVSDKDEDEDEYEDIKEGQQVVGKVVQAPTTGLVRPGQISQNTLDFLGKLRDPKCNDREWFRLHEPVYRVAEKEFKAFVEAFTDVLVETDPQVPPLPPKDVIHRIYRDVRFSNDKTPYKRNFSATFSRSGRKGVFAKYHVSIKPGNESMIAAGVWCPGRSELANIRTNLQRSSRRFRRVLSDPEFVRYFGAPEPLPDGGRQSVFGHDDELKVAPKGVAKDHPDIALLKCRTLAVIHRFTDSEVLEPDFKDKLGVVVGVMRPFVYALNDLIVVGGGDDSSSGPDDDEEEEEEEEEEEGEGP